MINIIKITILTMLFAATSQAALYENWNSGEPSDPDSFWAASEDCAEIYASNGKWNDRGCAIAFPGSNGLHYSCYNGVFWSLTREKSDLNNGSAHSMCQELGDEFYFAAPFNNYENEKLRKELVKAGVSSAWINIGDWINGEGNWIANDTNVTAVAAPYITRWAGPDPENFDEPDNGGSAGNQDCTVLDENGFWHDTECDAGTYRFLCADPGVEWYLSTVSATNTDLYAGERACRNSNILYSFKAPTSDPEYQGTMASVLASVGAGELVWVNVNDRLGEGNHLANENRYFWNDNEPNGHLAGTEECVVKNSNATEYGWNDIACSGGSVRAYACYQHATGNWISSSVTSATFNLQQGVSACQAEDAGSHKYTFWAPINPSQNASAPTNVWLNIQYSSSESQWLVNRDSTEWGNTVVWDKDGDGFNTNFRNITEPNNGIFPSHASKSPNLEQKPGSEHCATQQPGGYWYDVSCSIALSFACFDSNLASLEPWRLAPAAQNTNIYSGEEACKALDPSHKYHFYAPTNRQQQIELSNTAGQVAVWINATDRIQEKAWRYNEFLTFWQGEGADPSVQPQQPVSDDNKDCAIADGNLGSQWQAVSCSENHQFLCFDGTSWSLAAGTMGIDGIVSGQTACRTISASHDFSAPKTLAEQVAASAVINTNQVWVNAFDSEVEGDWKINQLRFWDVNEPDVANAASEDCAVLKQDNSRWYTDACAGTSRSYLCFDIKNEKWKISTTQGDMTHFPQGQNACEAMNTLTEEYLFAAPNYSWENDAAVSLIPVGEEVWINGNDRILEGNWVFNQSLYWSGTALINDPDSKDCLTMNKDGYWQDTACNDGPFQVACYSGDGWYIAPSTSSLANFSDGQRACDEIGDGYRFFAPTSEKHNRDLRALISGTDSIWINGIDIAEEGRWVFNSTGLPTPNWASSEPNGITDENCAYVNDAGLWYDSACNLTVNSAKQVVCKTPEPSSSIFISAATVVLNTDNGFDNAHQACNAETAGSVFYAPKTFNENEKLRQMMSVAQEVWVNTTDDLVEANWTLNVAETADYQITGTAAIDGCGTLDNNGNVIAEDCSLTYGFACSNGFEWKVSNTKAALGLTATDGSLIRNGFAACQQDFSGDFTFAVPENDDFNAKWQLAQALSLSGEDKTWLNVADWFVADQFSANMPYQNIATSPAQANTGCAYVDGLNSGWLVANQCDAFQAHFACFGGGTWQIAPADGTIIEPGTPQPLVDAWDQSYGDLRCKEFFGQAYSFAAPLTPKEDAELRRAVSLLDHPIKATWINFYANRLWTLNGQQWFNDRVNLDVVDGINIDQGSTTEDCGLLTKTAGKLILTDEVCTAEYSALCFEGSNWKATSAAQVTQWNKASAQCGELYDETHMFAIPRDSLERSQVLTLLNEGQSVWVNYSDIAVESKWRANLPLRQWWAASEPTNLGNRDCVVMDGAGATAGEWRSDYCDQAFHSYACNRGNAWMIVDVDGSTGAKEGIWAQGFSACRNIPDDSNGPWQFAFPEDYFANLSAATSLTANADLNAALAGKSAWLNLTDQYREKDWQRGRQFSDWAANFAFDDNKDCAFVDTTVTEINGESVEGSWAPGLCHESDENRKYACTNGKNWTLADAISPATGNNWSDGFDACAALAPANSWTFAAPNTSFDNERLKMAIGKGSAWINLQDVSSDGDWAANLTKPNLPPVIKFTASTALINTSPVQEQEVNLLLEALIIDPEGLAINSVVVTEETGLASLNVSPTAMPCASNCTYQISYTAPALTNAIETLKFKFIATDAAGKETFTFKEIEVLPPLVAWFDFNTVGAENLDISGNDNHANDNPEQPYDFPPVANGALLMDAGTDQKMTVPNLITNTGSQLPASYAVAMRVRIDGSDQLGQRPFTIKLASDTNKCLDMPGNGAASLADNANAVLWDCDGYSDQSWYYDESTGFIHNVANDQFCLAHPDGNPLEARNVALYNCSSVNQAWDFEGNLIVPRANNAFALQITGTANGDNMNLTAKTGGVNQTFVTYDAIGRGLVQRGSNDSSMQPMLRLKDNNNLLDYAVTSASGVNQSVSASQIQDEQWVNLVLNVDDASSQMTLFIDGVAQPAAAISGAVTVNTDAMVFGHIASSVRGFKGQMDDIQIFERPLTAEEVKNILPEPPVGFAQFESAQIDLQEPQLSAASLTMPIIIRRTDGSNGPMRAYISSMDGSASSPSDYTALSNQMLEWAVNEPALRPTPEYGLIPLLSAANGDLLNSVEFNRTQALFAAFDLTVPANPVGVVWEQGDVNNGALVAFNDANQLVIRAGGDGANAARLVIDPTPIIGLTGTLLVEINPTTNTVSAWFMTGGLLGTSEVISLGSATAASAFPAGAWSNGAQGRVGDISIIQARFIRDRLNGSTQNASGHWVEVEAYAVSNPLVNIAASLPGSALSAFSTDGVTLTPVSPVNGTSLTQIVDGVVTSNPYVDLGNGERIVQIELDTNPVDLDRINIRHYFQDGRSYNATKLEISSDGVDWTPIFDSAVSGTYQETAAGRNFNRMVNEAGISTTAFAAVTMARFYNQAAPSPLQQTVANAKLVPVQVFNELGFDREPSERFNLNVVSVEKNTDGNGWVDHSEGTNGSLASTEVKLLDYTKNTAGIFQFNVSDIECSEPHAGDNDGSMDLHASTGRLYRSCEVQVQRRTGVVGEVQISYGIDSGNVNFTDDPVHSGNDLTDMVLDQKIDGGNGVLTFPQGVSVRSIGFRTLADKPSVYENNEKFRISLFNPVNTNPNAQAPWMGDPISVEVTLTDYAVGEVEMTSSTASLPEPLYSSEVGADNFVIRTVSVSRRNGSNGIARVNVTAADATATGADYQLVDELGNPLNPAPLEWLDGQSDAKPVYVKVFADRFQEYIDNVQATDSAADCYDGNSDGIADNADRNCFAPESFTLTLTQNGGTTPVSSSKSSATVFIADNTAPANVTLTASIADQAVVSERNGTAAVNDVDSDGVYDEAKEGVSVPDNSMTVTVTRDNRYSEHAFYLDFVGVSNGTTVAASIGDNTGNRNTHDITIPAASGADYDFTVDLVSTGTDGARRYLLTLPQDTISPEVSQAVTLTVDILDNERNESADRQVDIQLQAAGSRDTNVVSYTGFPAASSLLRGFGISDVNLPPVFIREVNDTTLAFPYRNGGSMAVRYHVELSNDPEPTNNNPIVNPANYAIKALDQDWINVDYSIDDGVQTAQVSAAEYPTWSFGDISTQWDYLQPFNTATGAPYLPFVRNFAITATDSEGATANTNITFARIKPRWMRITGFNDCVRETGNDVKDNGCTNDGASQWLAVPDKDVANAYRLINGWEGKCMTANSASNDADIRVANCTDNNPLQRWQFDGAGSSIRLRQDDDDYKLCRIAFTSGDLRIRTGGCTDGAVWTEWNNGDYVPR
jgi:hypothetical protein